MNTFLIVLKWYIIGIIPMVLTVYCNNRHLRKKVTYGDAAFVAGMAFFGPFTWVVFAAWLIWTV